MWMEDDNGNKKSYPVTGTVTISTEEFRDLVNDKYESEKKAEYEHDRWYKIYIENSDSKKVIEELKDRIKVLEEKVMTYKDFLDSNDDIANQYRLYRMAKIGEEE